jgi:Flp pilus assembly protein TadG
MKVITRKRRERGGAMLELALVCPWIFLLFIGALDWGFYAYSLISLQAAARSAMLYTQGTSATAADSDTACSIVRNEMKSLPNVNSLTACGSLPLIVAATSVTGPDSAPAARVSVTYRTPSLIPIPGLLQKQLTITRIVMTRIKQP